MAHKFTNFSKKKYITPVSKKLKGVRITQHDAPSGKSYTIEFGCIATRYLNLANGKAVHLLDDELNPNRIYFETVEPNRKGSTYTLTKTSAGYSIRIVGFGAVENLDKFTKGGESIKDYWLFEDDGYYAIEKGNPWRGE